MIINIMMENTQQNKSEKLIIDSNHIGIIIGKGGNTINQIRKDTGANIQLKKPTHDNPDHCAIINGTDDQISDTIQYINKIINRVFKQDNTNQISDRWKNLNDGNDRDRGLGGGQDDGRGGGQGGGRYGGQDDGQDGGRYGGRGRGRYEGRGGGRGRGRGGGRMGKPRDFKSTPIVEKAEPFSYQMTDFPSLPLKKIDNQTQTNIEPETNIPTKSFADMVNYIEHEKEVEIIPEPKMVPLTKN
jgi:hypothetical protein